MECTNIYETLDLGPPSSDEDGYDSDGSKESNDIQHITTNAGKGTFRLFTENAEFIGFCEFKRYRWYLNKGLASIYTSPSGEEGLILNFKPKNEYRDEYKKIIKRTTLCHCCGSTIRLRKFHVLPSQIKKYYPDEKKMHNITDILLLCENCASVANKCADKFKNKICSIMDLKSVFFCDIDKDKIKSLAVKLYKIHKKYKENRIDKYKSTMEQIKLLLNIENDLTYEQIIEYSKLDCQKDYEGSPDIGHYIVTKFKEKNKLDYLTNKWKINFISCMNPQFLPSDFVESLIQDQDKCDDCDEIKQYLYNMGFINV